MDVKKEIRSTYMAQKTQNAAQDIITERGFKKKKGKERKRKEGGFQMLQKKQGLCNLPVLGNVK